VPTDRRARGHSEESTTRPQRRRRLPPTVRRTNAVLSAESWSRVTYDHPRSLLLSYPTHPSSPTTAPTCPNSAALDSRPGRVRCASSGDRLAPRPSGNQRRCVKVTTRRAFQPAVLRDVKRLTHPHRWHNPPHVARGLGRLHRQDVRLLAGAVSEANGTPGAGSRHQRTGGCSVRLGRLESVRRRRAPRSPG
jgi:hypothetical protein